MRLHLPLLAVLGTTAAFAATAAPLPLPVMSQPEAPRSWTMFPLLPKAFHRNPTLDMTVICELTDFGRTQPLASPEAPVYYVCHNRGYTSRGDAVGDRPPHSDYLGRVLERSLTINGFLPATAGHPPSLLLIFHWGSHYAMDPELRRMFRVQAVRHVQERAILVGGRQFESSVARRFAYGDALTDHTDKLEFLTYQANDSLYFAVVSAYDLASLRRGERRLAWRASLTVNAQGVSMTDSLPALILTAGPSFGRNLTEPEIVLRRVRRGAVDYGPAEVIESDVPLAAPGRADAKSN